MIHFRNKLFLALAFLAFSVFLSVSLGGEFLHQHIHHHQSKASHDNCPVYQLLAQVFLFAVVLGFGLQRIKFCSTVLSDDLLVSRPPYLLPSLRAPPVSL